MAPVNSETLAPAPDPPPPLPPEPQKSGFLNAISWLGRIGFLVVGSYIASDLIIKWRQGKVNEKATIQELLGEGVDQHEWMNASNRTEIAEICKHEPVDFLDKVVMRKAPGSREREELLILLRIANPDWCKQNGLNLREILWW
jgi:hypothetical protein